MIGDVKFGVKKLKALDKPQQKYQNRHLIMINQINKQRKIPDAVHAGQGLKKPLGKQNEVIIQPGRIRPIRPNSRANPVRTTDRAEKENQQDFLNNNVVQQYLKKLQERPNSPLGSIHEKRLRILEEKINEYWEQFEIPIFHRKAFNSLTRDLNQQRLNEILQREIEAIYQKKSLIQIALRGVKARESCILALQNKIKELDEKLQPIQLKQATDNCSELVNHLRILTVSAVESILRWRENLLQFAYFQHGNKGAQIHIPFLLFSDKENYLLRLKDDTEFLKETPLQQYISLGKTSDPFFLSAQNPAHFQLDTPQILHDIRPALMNRIRASQLIILEEGIYYQYIMNQMQEEQQLMMEENSQLRTNKSQQSLRNSGVNKSNRKSQIKEQSSGIQSNQNSVNSPTKFAPINSNISQNNVQVNNKNSNNNNSNNNIGNLNNNNNSISNNSAEKQPGTGPSQPAIIKNESKIIQNQTKIEWLPIGIYEDDVKQYLTDYLATIPEHYQKTFYSETSEIIGIVQNQMQGGWFYQSKTKSQDQPTSLGIVYVDKNHFQNRRLHICHFSTNQPDFAQFQRKLNEFLKIIWEQDTADEIWITLKDYEVQPGKLSTHPEILKFLQSIGFKWKQAFYNNEKQARETQFSLKRPDAENQETKIRIIQKAQEPIWFKSLAALVSQGSKYDLPIFSNDEYDNFVIIAKLLHDHQIDQTNPQLTADEIPKLFNQSINDIFIKNQKDKLTINGEKFCSFQHQQKLEIQINWQKMFTLPSLYYERTFEKVDFTMQNMTFRLADTSYLMVHESKEEYIKIKPDSSSQASYLQNTYNSVKNPLYLIPTEDEKIRIFILELGDTDLVELKKQKLQKFVKDLMISNEIQSKPISEEELYIPHLSFETPLHKIEIGNEELEQKQLEVEEKKLNYKKDQFFIQKLIQINSFKIDMRPQLDAALLSKQISETSNSQIFQFPLVIGLIHDDIFQKFEYILTANLFEQNNNLDTSPSIQSPTKAQ